MAIPTDDLDSITEKSKGPGASRLVLWLVIASLGGLLLSLNLIVSTLKEENANLATELEAIQATLEAPEVIPPEEQLLQDNMLHLREQLNTLQTMLTNLEAQHIDWPGVMLTIGDYDETRLRLTGVEQTGHRVILSGQASDESVVMAYAQLLRESEWFNAVLIQAISQIDLPTQRPAEGAPASPAIRVAEFAIAVELKANEP